MRSSRLDVIGDRFLRRVGVPVPQRTLVREVTGGDGLLVSVLPVVVLQCVDVVVLAELSNVLAGSEGQVGLIARARGDVSRGGGLEVRDVSHAREARPAGGNVQRGFGVRIVGTGSGHQVSLVVLARRRVGPCGGSVRDGGFAAGDFGTEVTDGEVDGTAPAGFGGDGGLGAGGVGGFVRVGASHVAVPEAVAGVNRGSGRAVVAMAVPSTSAAGMVRGCRVDMTVSSMVLMRLFRGSLAHGCAHSTVRRLFSKLTDNIVK